MKLLLENWRKFINEDEDATLDMGGKSWQEIESDAKKRARQGAAKAGFYFDRKLGKGQMGEVYAADRLADGATVAIKFIHQHWVSKPEQMKRFREEVVAARKVSHPAVVEILDVGEYEKQKSLDEVEITKVDGLKIVELKINKQLEERYPELAEKRVAFGLTQEMENVAC